MILLNFNARHSFDGCRRASYFDGMKTHPSPLVVVAALAAALLATTPSPIAHAQSDAEGPGSVGSQRPLPELGPRLERGEPVKPHAKKPVAPAPAQPPPAAQGDDTAPVTAGEQTGDHKGQQKATTPPPDTPQQRRRALDDLYAHLAAADSVQATTPLVAGIERLWLFSGSDTIDVLMERVMKAVAEQKLELAGKLADAIIDIEPGFAEGWNRRALVSFLRGDRENALNALHRALALEPNHFKALDGMAKILRDQGDKKSALKTYERLLDVHPYWDDAKEAVEELKREIQGDKI